MNRTFEDINKDITNIASSSSKLGSDVTNIGSSSLGGLSDLPKLINLPGTSEFQVGSSNLSSTSSNMPGRSIISDITEVGSSNAPLSQGISSSSQVLSGSSHVLPSSSINSNIPRVEETTNLSSNIDESNKNIGGISNLLGKIF
jgi:hypothetical protein